MAIGDAYLTTAEFKTRSRSASSANDAAIAAVVASASRSIEGFCGRQFNKSATAETRYFTLPRSGGAWYEPAPPGWLGLTGGETVLETGDLVSVAEIATDDDGSRTYATVWETTDFDLIPLSPMAGWPYTAIAGSPRGTLAFPAGGRAIRISGVFGWPEVPAPVKEVCFMTANRLKSLWDAPFGLSGGGEMGTLDMTTSITPIIAQMLAPYVVRTV
jgi:hypothetical protein